MGCIYLVTNENIRAYNIIYDFKGKSILSVLGSGDQYFGCLLSGAKKVDLYDNNPNAWHYFLLKVEGIKQLEYGNFYHYFLTAQLNHPETYQKLRPSLPYATRKFFDCDYDDLSDIIYSFSRKKIYTKPKYGDGSVIPYLDKDSFYKLKKLLHENPLPTFYNENILKLAPVVKGEHDIMLASNIHFWLYDSRQINYDPLEYKDFLDTFNIDVVQASYFWGKTGLEKFTNAGYHCTEVPPTNRYRSDRNYVLTYTRKPMNIPKRVE